MKISLIILDCARFNRTRSSNQNDWFVVVSFPGSPRPQTKNVYCKQPKAGRGLGTRPSLLYYATNKLSTLSLTCTESRNKI